MDISMDIHEKSVNMDMDMDVIFHIQGNPGVCGSAVSSPSGVRVAAEGFSCILCRQIAFPSISVRVAYSLHG